MKVDFTAKYKEKHSFKNKTYHCSTLKLGHCTAKNKTATEAENSWDYNWNWRNLVPVTSEISQSKHLHFRRSSLCWEKKEKNATDKILFLKEIIKCEQLLQTYKKCLETEQNDSILKRKNKCIKILHRILFVK